MLQGLKRRLALLGVGDSWAVTVGSCCHFRNVIMSVFESAVVVQNAWHFIMRCVTFQIEAEHFHVLKLIVAIIRYLVCVLGGTKNPFRGEVGEDISNATFKSKAHDGIPARYRSKEDQEERLISAYNKWVARSDVWGAAAEKV